MPATKSRLPIFEYLSRLDKQDMDVYESVPEDDQKEFDTFVSFPALMWMSAAKDPFQHMMCLLSVNETCNGYFLQREHPELQAKLLAASGIKERVRHSFPKQLKSKKEGPLLELVRAFFPDADDEDCRFYLSRCSVDDIKSMAEKSNLYGDDKKKLKSVVDEFKKQFA